MNKTGLIITALKAAKRSILPAGVAALALYVSSPAASAGLLLVGAQFAPTGSTAYTGKGVFGESFSEFTGPTDINYPNNSYPGSTEALGSSGVSLTATPTVTAGADSYFSNNGNGGSTTNLFGNFLASHNSGFTFTLSGLTAGSNYSLALYAGDLGTRGGDNPVSFTINGTPVPFTVGPTNGGGAFIQQTATTTGNYEIVNNVVANSSGNIVIASAIAGGNGYSEINGISVESVPEPSAWIMSLLGTIGIGSVAVARRHRRKIA